MSGGVLREVKVPLLLCLGVIVVDAVIVPDVILAVLVTVIAVPTYVTKVIRSRETLRTLAPRFAIYAVMWGCIIVVHTCNNRIAQGRAERIVTAAEEYKRSYGRYPNALADLVPHFLPHVPLARLTLIGNRFRYWVVKDTHHLVWALPLPVGRAHYVFEERRWSHGS